MNLEVLDATTTAGTICNCYLERIKVVRGYIWVDIMLCFIPMSRIDGKGGIISGTESAFMGRAKD